MNRSWISEITAVLATVVAVAAYFGELPVFTGYFADLPLVVVVSLLVIAFAIGWPRLLELPSPTSASIVIALGSLSAVALVVLKAEAPLMQWIPVMLGIMLIVAYFRELLRKDGRERLVESVIGTVAGLVIGVFGSGWIAAIRSGFVTLGIGDQAIALAVVLVGAVALAVSCLVSNVHLKGWYSVSVVVVASTAAAGLLAWPLNGVTYVAGALIGLMVGILFSAVRSLYAKLPTAGKWPAVLASITLPVVATGIAIYIIGLVGTMFTR